jgi:murein DD-endopeptidase MepM/ murein hydrolase activator NlpD
LAERAVSGAAPAPPQLHSHRLQWPVAEPTVSSPFGMRVHPITGVYKLHDGTDFAAACGVPVLASADGFVRQVGQRGAYGLQVTVDHGVVGDDQVTTSYSHLSAIAVTAGQKVTVGQPIGRVGTTGSSTGCHLHFMVYADGVVTDPMNWLPAQRRQQHRRETRSHPDQLDRPDKVGGQRSGPRMRLSIRQAQSVDRHVGIDLRGS